MDRTKDLKRKKLFRISVMVDWLLAKTGASSEMSKAVLGAWISILRHEVLLRAERDREFLHKLQGGKGELQLSNGLAPEGWNDEELWAQISEETGLLNRDVHLLLQEIGEKLHTLKRDEAFEPIGRFSGTGRGDFRVCFWPDFLQPLSDDPEELIFGTDPDPSHT